jgi:aminoglycoside 3-N-acetyltransferase
MAVTDSLIAAGEVLARQIYWRRTPRAERATAQPAPVHAAELSERLHAIAASAGNGLLMVHSSADRLNVVEADGSLRRGAEVASWLLRTLLDAAGDRVTLCMPTHPLYKADPGFMFDKSDLVLRYSHRRTPSRVGLLTELFRRQPGTVRSRHPLSSLAARGPRAEALLASDLDGPEPLPHGAQSSYHRFCREGGTAVSIGVAGIKSMTILHVGEEVQDQRWPIPDFFYPRRFEVEEDDGSFRVVTVRERRPEYVRSLALERMRRDLVACRLLREETLGGVRIDSADARGVLEFMLERQADSTYPYLWPSLARLGRSRRAA